MTAPGTTSVTRRPGRPPGGARRAGRVAYRGRMVTPPTFPPATAEVARPDVAPARGGHIGPALVVAFLASAGVWAVWRVFVSTRTGRLLDEAAFEGAEFGRNELWDAAESVLDVISIPFIIGVLLATMLLAVLRRRVLLAVQVAFLMGGANLTTQLLKMVFDRPEVGAADALPNSLPSGHTTAAASVAAALVLVVPRRLRPAAAVGGAVYTVATGVSTLVAGWHRPSDAVAAVLVVLAWAGLASAAGGIAALGRGTVAPGTDPPRETTAVATLLLLAGGAAGVMAALALQRGLGGLDAGLDSTAELLTAYGGGALGVVAVTCVTFGVLLLMRRSAEPRRA